MEMVRARYTTLSKNRTDMRKDSTLRIGLCHFFYGDMPIGAVKMLPFISDAYVGHGGI